MGFLKISSPSVQETNRHTVNIEKRNVFRSFILTGLQMKLNLDDMDSSNFYNVEKDVDKDINMTSSCQEKGKRPTESFTAK